MIIALLAMLSAYGQRSAASIPAAYYGAWDAYPAACGYLVSDMRLGIEPREFTIYRDQFRVHQVIRKTADILVLRVSSRSHDDFDNEGFSRPYQMTWRLSDSGNTLTMTTGKDSSAWHRCPKLKSKDVTR